MAQTSSLVEDGDLDLRNDALWSTLDWPALYRLLSLTSENGSLFNTFAVGASVLWAPAYALGWAVSSIASPVPETRWSGSELTLVCLTSLVLALWVVWFLDRWMRWAGAPRSVSFVGAVGLLVGTPLMVYSVHSYTMSHLASAFAACLFVGTVVRLERLLDGWSGFLCGSALGLLFLCRWQELVMGVLLVIPASRLIGGRARFRRTGGLVLSVLAGFAPVAALQPHAWFLERGEALVVPQGTGYVRWFAPELGHFLFSGLSGLLVWCPLIAVCTLGLALPWRCRVPRRWALVGLAVVGVSIYVNACVSDWWGGVSYGPRRLTSLVPFLALGMANLARTGGRRLVLVVLSLAIAWGVFTAALFVGGVRDLSLVFAGRPSEAPPAAREEPQLNVEQAQELARTWPRALSRSRPEAGSPLWLVTAAALACLSALAGVLARRSAKTLLATLSLAGFCIVGWAHLRLVTGTAPDRQEQLRWRRFASAHFRPEPAGEELSPSSLDDAYAVGRALAAIGMGERETAERTLSLLKGGSYPVIDVVRRELPSLPPERRNLSYEAGVFHTVRSGSRYRVVRVWVPREARSQRLFLEFVFQPPELDLSRPYPIVTLRFDERVRAGLALGGEEVAHLGADSVMNRAGLAWRPATRYRVLLVWQVDRGELTALITGGGESLHLSVALAGPEVPPVLQLYFGRPREWRGEETAWGAIYREFRALTAPR